MSKTTDPYPLTKRSLLLGGFVFLLFVMPVNSLSCQEKVTECRFCVTNKTNIEFFRIMLSPANKDHWSGNLLEENALKPDQSIWLDLMINPQIQLWDLRTVDRYSSEIDWFDLKLEKNGTLLLVSDGKGPSATWEKKKK